MEHRSTLELWTIAGALFVAAALASHAVVLVTEGEIVRLLSRLMVIVFCGLALNRIHRLTPSQAVAVGFAWAVLAIGTEIVLTSMGHSGWFELLGNPALEPGWLRGLNVLAWLAAPRLNTGA